MATFSPNQDRERKERKKRQEEIDMARLTPENRQNKIDFRAAQALKDKTATQRLTEPGAPTSIKSSDFGTKEAYENARNRLLSLKPSGLTAEQEIQKKAGTDTAINLLNSPAINPTIPNGTTINPNNVTEETLQGISGTTGETGISPSDMKSQMKETAIKDAAIGAAAGIPLAAATFGLSVVGGVALGAIEGGVRGYFAAYKHEETEKVESSQINIDSAKTNIAKSILLANKGGNEEISVTSFRNAIDELNRAQVELKNAEINGKYNWATDVRLKQQELDNYINYILPLQRDRLTISLQKPDPNYVDYSLMGGAI